MNLLFHQGALGDWVLTFPILRALPRQTVAVTAWSKAMLAATLIDEVEPFNIEMREFSRLHASDGPAAIGPAVADILTAARTVVSFLSDGEDAWAANVAKLAPRAHLVCVPPRPDDAWPDHVSDWHFDRLKRGGLELARAPVAAKRSPNELVLVHPGSGGADKCWPLERFEQLCGGLAKAGHRVRMILGEVEAETWEADTRRRLQDTWDARVLADLATLRANLDEASTFVGNDSGPAHLAAQMGLATVALFGPTPPRRWAPIGPRVTTIAPPRPSPMTWLEVNRVVDAVASC